jgi:putative glutamine amidotransferase
MMMKKILIAGDCGPKKVEERVTYCAALRAVGAMDAISYAKNEAEARALADSFDALLLPGGGDLPAFHYGKEPHPAESYDDPLRDRSDMLLLDAFRTLNKRVLGICRGCQVGNVYFGGTLHQHLPDAYDPVLWHSGNITGRHTAVVEPGTLLSSLFGSGAIPVNSSHHQAINRIGEGLRMAAKAPDGVIEAVEGENILLIQWHPECMLDAMLPIFKWIAA